MNKFMQGVVTTKLKKILGDDYATNQDLHADDIDNAAIRVSEEMDISEDDVRYHGNLPR